MPVESLGAEPTRQGSFLAPTARWLWERPLLVVLLAHSVFSIGIWNACDGYGKETSNVAAAFRLIRPDRPSSSIYVHLIALSLRHLTPDPGMALTMIKYGGNAGMRRFSRMGHVL